MVAPTASPTLYIPPHPIPPGRPSPKVTTKGEVPPWCMPGSALIPSQLGWCHTLPDTPTLG